ncbi:hypothetical protein, partial [Cohnella boryungensis]
GGGGKPAGQIILRKSHEPNLQLRSLFNAWRHITDDSRINAPTSSANLAIHFSIIFSAIFRSFSSSNKLKTS